MGIFDNYDSPQSRTDKPWDIGLGIRYKNISASFSVSVPFVNQFNLWSYDFEISSYFDKIYFEAYFKRYPNFIINKTGEQNDFDIHSSGIMATFLHNNKNHSLGSVNKLDKKQNLSSGSLLYGFGIFHSSLYSNTGSIEKYNDRQFLLYFGPSIGYSYTWVFQTGIFLNLSLIHFSSPAVNINTGNWLYIPQISPKIIFGNHYNTWSANLKLTNHSAFMIWGNNYIDALTFISITIMISKRI